MNPSSAGSGKLRIAAEEASRICMKECRAMCCQGPLVLRLRHDEVDEFRRRARSLGVDARVVSAPDGGGGWVRFAEHLGERCPMLEPETWACRVYEHRPQRCREFPERITPGCPLSEVVFGGEGG